MKRNILLACLLIFNVVFQSTPLSPEEQKEKITEVIENFKKDKSSQKYKNVGAKIFFLENELVSLDTKFGTNEETLLSYFAKNPEQEASDIVARLIALGARQIPDKYNKTPLEYAAQLGNPKSVEYLIYDGFTNEANRQKALSIASDNNKKVIETIEKLMSATSADQINAIPGIEQGDKDLALLLQIKANNVKAIDALLNAKADIGALDLRKNNALLFSIQNNNINIFKKALQNEKIIEDINQKIITWGKGSTEEALTPLMYTAFLGMSDFVEALLQVPGIEVNKKNSGSSGQKTALIYALAKPDNVKIIEKLLAKGADVNLVNAMGNITPLMRAVDFGFVENVKALLADKKINLEAKNNLDGTGAWRTALWMAVMAKDPKREIVKALIDAGANIYQTNGEKKTLKQYAQEHSHKEIAKILEQADESKQKKELENVTSELEKGKKFIEAFKNKDIKELAQLFKDSYIKNMSNNPIFENAITLGGKKISLTPLAYAAFNKEEGLIDFLLNQTFINVDALNSQKNTALMIASLVSDNEKIIEKLLAKGANVNAQNEAGDSALMIAIMLNKITNIEALLKGPKIDLALKNKDLKTAFDLASNNSAIQNLLKGSAEKNVQNSDLYKTIREIVTLLKENKKKEASKLISSLSKEEINTGAFEGTPLLNFAAMYGDAQLIDEMVKKGADINRQDPQNKSTPLMYALLSYNNETLQELIKYKPNYDLKNSSNETIFTLLDGQPELSQYIPSDLWRAYEDKVTQNFNDIFAKIDEKTITDPQLMEKIKNMPSVIIHQDSNLGQTLLIKAIAKSRFELAGDIITLDGQRKMEKAISCLNMQTKKDYTALMFAVINKNEELVRRLMHAGADVYLKNNQGNTALNIAEQKSYTSILALLKKPFEKEEQASRILDAIAELILQGKVHEPITMLSSVGRAYLNTPLAKMKNDETILILAVRAQDNPGLIRSILLAGANINVPDKEGNTALMEAVALNKERLVETLINGRADINLKNNKGQTAYDLAQQIKNEKILQLLKDAEKPAKGTDLNRLSHTMQKLVQAYEEIHSYLIES